MSHLEKFRVGTLEVARFHHWLVAVRTKQITPGALVVLPLAPYAHFADVPSEAAAELFGIVGQLETIALSDLSADRVNVVAAMMKDPFVHFHFFPRFGGPAQLFGAKWVDVDWPRAITLRDVETQDETLQAVRAFYSDLFSRRS